MKRSCGYEQDVIGSDHAVLGIDHTAFHDGQKIPLHTFTRNIRGPVLGGAGNFVDFVNKNNASLLHPFTGSLNKGFSSISFPDSS